VIRDCSPANSIEVLSAPLEPLRKAFEVHNADRECLVIKLQRVNKSVPGSSNGRFLELSIEPLKLATSSSINLQGNGGGEETNE
jgi:hypothetical protein